MFNYGQHSIIWIIEIDHRTSLFLIQIFIRSWQNKTWRELLFTVMIIWRWKEFSEKLQNLNGSSHYFHSLIVRRDQWKEWLNLKSTDSYDTRKLGFRSKNDEIARHCQTMPPPEPMNFIVWSLPWTAHGGPTISTNQMTVFFCWNCLFFGLNQCRNSCNLFCSVIPTSV